MEIESGAHFRKNSTTANTVKMGNPNSIWNAVIQLTYFTQLEELLKTA